MPSDTTPPSRAMAATTGETDLALGARTTFRMSMVCLDQSAVWRSKRPWLCLFQASHGMVLMKSGDIDQFDHAILELVQADNQLPARILAERVGLSESAVLRRLREMRKNGIIVADIAVVRPDVLGKSITVHVLVSLERETSEHLESFVKKLRRRSEVDAAWYVTGEFDFILQLRLSGMEAYDNFVCSVFHSDSNVRSFRTLVSMREVVGTMTKQRGP